MPGSHMRCQKCRKNLVDKRAGYQMCASCRAAHRHQLSSGRKKIKARKAARRLLALQPSDGALPEPMPETPLTVEQAVAQTVQNGIVRPPIGTTGSPERAEYMRSFRDNPATPEEQQARQARTRLANGRLSRPQKGQQHQLTAEQEHEVMVLYLTTNTPVDEIASTYGILPSYPFKILGDHGITWRRRDQTRRGVPPPPVPGDTVPRETQQALENMLKLPPKPEPRVSTHRVKPAPQGPAVGAEFEVQVRGTLSFYGQNMEAVLAEVRSFYPGLSITALRQVDPD